MNVEEIAARMNAIMAAADARPVEERSLTEAEVTEYEDLEGQLQAARRDSDLRKRHAAYKTPVVEPIQATVPKDDTLDRAFNHYLRTGQQNADLVELRAQGEGTPSAGGYMVPDGFRAKIIERMRSFGGVLNAVEVITTESGNPISWPTLDDNVSAEIVPEHGTGSNGADIVFGTGSLGAYKYMSLGASNLPLRVSVELLQDAAFDVEALVARVLGKRIRRAMAADAVNGDGSGEPLGIAAGTAGHNLASGGTFTYAQLLAITHLIDPEYRVNASWAFNDVSFAALQGLVDTTGRPLLNDQNAALSGRVGNGFLLGYPVIIDSAFSDNSGDNVNYGVFGDLEAAYVWRNVRDIQLVVDPYGRAANGEVQFTAWARADGTVQDPNAYVILATQNT